MAAQTLDERIAEIESQIDSGVTTFTADGVTTTVDLEFLKSRLSELKAEKAGRTDRAPFVSLNLGSAW